MWQFRECNLPSTGQGAFLAKSDVGTFGATKRSAQKKTTEPNFPLSFMRPNKHNFHDDDEFISFDVPGDIASDYHSQNSHNCQNWVQGISSVGNLTHRSSNKVGIYFRFTVGIYPLLNSHHLRHSEMIMIQLISNWKFRSLIARTCPRWGGPWPSAPEWQALSHFPILVPASDPRPLAPGSQNHPWSGTHTKKLDKNFARCWKGIRSKYFPSVATIQRSLSKCDSEKRQVNRSVR